MSDWLPTAVSHFHFLRPWWLLGLLPTFGLLVLMNARNDVRRRWRGTIAPHLLNALVVEQGKGSWVRPLYLTTALLALGMVALAGPTWQQEHPPFLEDKAPLAVAVDLGATMDAIDVSPSRLERAKLKIKALLAQRSGARTAIYAYAGSTHPVLPLTDDARLLQTFVDALETRIMPVAGKDTALALRTISADMAQDETPGTIVFLTDGIEPAATAAFKAQVDSGGPLPVVLGIGTAQGGPVRDAQGNFVTQNGQRLFARFDVAALKNLGSAADVPVATVTLDSDDDVRWVQRHVQAHLAQKQAESRARWQDEGWWLCAPIALLAVLWFRKGWTVRWSAALLLGLLLGQPAPQAWAADAPAGPNTHATPAATGAAADPAAPAASATDDGGRHFIDWWLTRDQQGRRAFQQGDYARAASLFDDPTWRGVALYRARRFNEAVQSFALVDSPESDFNQGNALAQQGRFKDAVARYEAALARRPGWAAAQANLDLVRQLVPAEDDDEAPLDDEMKPNKGDQVQEDKKPGDKSGQLAQMHGEQSTDAWMRAIQTSPTGLLARKFRLQEAQPAPAAK